MIRNYITITVRNLLRQKGNTVINLMGLAIGFTAFILIFLHIVDELSYDRFHARADRIYRVSVDGMVSGDVLNVAVSAGPTGETMVRDIPQIISFTRIDKFPQSVHFSCNNRSYYQEGLLFVDSSFFDLFSFDLIRGNPQKALVEPYSLVLTHTAAKKYFNEQDPIGQNITMNNNATFTITGIVEDPPRNSHFQFEVLASFTTMLAMNGEDAYSNWGSLSLYTYVLLAKGADPKDVEKGFPDLYTKYMEDLSTLENIRFEPYLQPLTSIHLHSNLMAELEPNSDIGYVYAFIAIAAFVLLIACINFMNLSTARSMKRAREVGLRKVVGANRSQLIVQFLGESIAMSFLAMVIGLILVELSLPTFNHLLDKEFTLGLFLNWKPTMFLFLLALLAGILAGSYPALYLSSFQPGRVLKGTLLKGSGTSGIRNALVVLQFTISIALIICTALVFEQLQFVTSKKLGFRKEHLLIIPLRGQELFDRAESIKQEMQNLACVQSISGSQFVPGRDMDGSGFIPEGYEENNPVIIFNNQVDADYIQTLQMEIIQGRDFSHSFSTDSNAVVINETLARKLAWDSPVNKKITGFGSTGPFDLKVIGVVSDYHFRSLHDVIEPSLLFIGKRNNRFLNVRLHPGDPQEAITILEDKWQELNTSLPFNYYFLDNDYDRLYRAEERVSEIFLYFTLIAIVVACLGLFGLASFNAEQKKKEIGIRKALGASVRRIVLMLSRKFTALVLLANILAWPIAYYFMQGWLNQFAYRLYLPGKWWIFLLSALAALLIALLTVSYQAVRAAYVNPVDAIKYE